MKKPILYWSPYSILVSTAKGLVRKSCPFPVLSIHDTKDIGRGQQFFVKMVRETELGKLEFEINENWYLYSHWKII